MKKLSLILLGSFVLSITHAQMSTVISSINAESEWSNVSTQSYEGSGGQSAHAYASATIVRPINITKTNDLNFGNVAVVGEAGTVQLDVNGVRSETGGITLPAASGTVSSAAFTVAGDEGQSYNVILPTSVTITNGDYEMTISDFVHNSNGRLSGGESSFNVGGVLHVHANQASGVYESIEPFEVTVGYN